MHEGGYGSMFSDIPMFRSNDTDTRIVCILSGMLVCVKELWMSTDKCPMSVLNWHGWLLSYLTRKCFLGVII